MIKMSSAGEDLRLRDASISHVPWRKWGPYLSERQWGTVREDYSAHGTAWDYFPHDHARSRAYRWGEDGLAGFSDDKQQLCFALALWNGADPILKERLFGLTNSEGNHGEDVKEYYFYLDSTPTHSYMKYLYKYPQTAYPYSLLVETNRGLSREASEYELMDTGVFDQNRYFDVFVEYAKETAEEILIRITVCNRGPKGASLEVLPTLWFRNTWSWFEGAERPALAADRCQGCGVIAATHPSLEERYLYAEGEVPLLFTENESNNERLWAVPNRTPFVKDGINNYIVHGEKDAVNPQHRGTKAAAQYQLKVGAGEQQVVRLRLSTRSPTEFSERCVKGHGEMFGKEFDDLLALRLQEADAFYDRLAGPMLGIDERNVQRQALAGMLWTKQYYYFDLDQWLKEHGASAPAAAQRMRIRNAHWFHMVNEHVISMPDKWEYPWYAAWDLAFHCVALAVVDLDFAKQQLELMLLETYLHPNGQIPAYEWNFGDVNPPVHAWAACYIYQYEKHRCGKGDVNFLKRMFQKLSLNFTWWMNRKDATGNNVFEGGFLGLDNIGVFDRSAPLPTGGRLEQSDGTAWMAFFSQCMLQIALELAPHDSSYEEMAVKYLEHFLWIATAMHKIGDHEDVLWDEKDGFFYDLLHLPDGRAMRLKIRSLVGLLPLCAVTVISRDVFQKFPRVVERVVQRLAGQRDLRRALSFQREAGMNGRSMLSVADEGKLRRILARMLDEREFLSPYGIRSLSRHHEREPYIFHCNGTEFRVDYWPAESKSGLFGGNSNWRGPIWFPVNVLLLRTLLVLFTYFGDNFKVECPTGSGCQMNLREVAEELQTRLTRIFLLDENGKRPVYGGTEKFQTDPHWKDLVLFYEYFHGDNGAGIGASHQTGWTGLVAMILGLDYLDTVRLPQTEPRARTDNAVGTGGVRVPAA
jgi:Glycosyl hydrolase family 63 C-terminal domain